MKAKTAFELIEKAIQHPVDTWRGFSIQDIPIAIYDADDVFYLNHPSPPIIRPGNLVSATAVMINDVWTATVPAEICEDEISLVPLVYHECFHVFQETEFSGFEDSDFFQALAHYPELKPRYRALCAAEFELLLDKEITVLAKLNILAELAKSRYEVLSQEKGLADFEQVLERKEGTAFFMEQKARFNLFKCRPEKIEAIYGYSRQYFLGAALCWLFEEIDTDFGWQVDVKNGASLTECLLLFSKNNRENVDLKFLAINEKRLGEERAVESILMSAFDLIDNLQSPSVLEIFFEDGLSIGRSFNPSQVISLGDGRIIYPDFLNLFTANGRIQINGTPVVEDIAKRKLTIPSSPFELNDGLMTIETEKISLKLEKVDLKNSEEIYVKR